MTGEFPVQKVSNAENVSILWRHHDLHIRAMFQKVFMNLIRNMCSEITPLD